MTQFLTITTTHKFPRQVSYISHINSKHGMNLREYREEFGSQEDIRQYTCLVPGCTRYVSWTYSGINDHLKSHNLTMNQYEATYLRQPTPAPQKPVEQQPLAVREDEIIEDMEGEEDEGPSENIDEIVELWSRGETRRCVLCSNDIVGNLPTFANHLTYTHQINIIQYSAQGRKFMSCSHCQELSQFKQAGS